MRRFSIRTVMAVIVVSAVGLAALRNANDWDWWAGTMLLLALAAIGVAMLGAVVLSGEARYWLMGFADGLVGGMGAEWFYRRLKRVKLAHRETQS